MSRRTERSDAGYSRQVVLLFCLTILVALFTLTGFLSRAFHQKEVAIAENWNNRGNAALAAGHAREARDCYRNALIYEPQNTVYQLHLARALAAFGRSDQSRAYLLNLLEQLPGDGEINLDLARLAAQDRAVDAAIHYYHGAIYGAWNTKPVESRRAARLELATFLVNHGQNTQAEAELIALAAGIPEDQAGMHAIVGQLFTKVGDLNRALAEFEIALKVAPRNVDALAGAGTAAFRLQDYFRAAAYLERALAERPEDADLKAKLEISRSIISSDPFIANLTATERAHRAALDLTRAVSRAEKCQGASSVKDAESPLATFLARAKATRFSIWSERGLAEHPEQIPAAMRVAFGLESESDNSCGTAEGPDLAIDMIRDLHSDIAAGAMEK